MALGYVVVGAAGGYSGVAIGVAAGFAIGCGLNVGFEAATGQFDGYEINKFGRNTGSFLTGGFSALAGKNFGESYKKGQLLADAKPEKYDAISQIKYQPFKFKTLGKFALGVLENLGSKLNQYNGKLDISEIGGLFGGGMFSAFASYSINYAGMKNLPNIGSKKGFGAAAIFSPLIAYTAADMERNYLNYLSYYKKPPDSFGEFYQNYFKSI